MAEPGVVAEDLSDGVARKAIDGAREETLRAAIVDEAAHV